MAIDQIIKSISLTFYIQYMGALSYFLGVAVAYHRIELFLS